MSRAVFLLLATAAGVVIGFCLAILAYHPHAATAPVDPAPPPRTIAQREIEDGVEHWRKLGFVEMTPPVRLPSDKVESDHIAVWLRIPDGKKITARVVDGHPTVKLPPGTTADRVETFLTSAGPVVGDVRGSTLVDDGELFHVFVPAHDGGNAPLWGWEWRRDDDDAQRAATALLLRHLSSVHTINDARMTKPQLLDDYQRNNNCVRCHAPNKRENLVDVDAIHRATDDDGWYLPLAVLTDTAPLETHRARDMNVGDPLVALECPSGAAPTLLEDDEGARRYRCPDRGVPVGTLDVKTGVARHDPHTLAVCAARKYLADHMEPDARALFAKPLAACGL